MSRVDFAVLECSCSSAHAVPFNRRLLSSTPAGTPKRKKLVERQGVLLLNGSTETQILNSTDTAAAVRPPSPPRPSGPCLSRGDVQFAAAPHQLSSSSSIAGSTGSCDVPVDAVSAVAAAAYPAYSLASSRSVPYRGASVPCYSTVHSAAWQLPSSSQPVIYTAAGNSSHLVNTSLERGVGYSQMSHLHPPATSHVHSDFGALYRTVPISGGFAVPRSAMDPFRHPVSLETQTRPSAPGLCTQPTVSTNVLSTAVASGRARPPVTLTASSSQETIEIHLESSPGRSEPQERFTMVRATTTDRNRRQHPRSTGARDRHTSNNRGRRSRCRSTAADSDTEQLISLLRQLKVFVTANHNPEVARLLNEVCEAARVSLLMPPSQVGQPAAADLSPTVEQLQSEIMQLNRLERMHIQCVHKKKFPFVFLHKS